MRSILLALAVCTLNLPCLIGADKATREEETSSATSIVIEARFVSMKPEIEQVLKRIDPNLGMSVSSAPKPELHFSADNTKQSGGSDIQLISAAAVVEEQPPVHILKLNAKQKSEIQQIVEQLFPNQVLAQSPKITVADNTIGQISDTSEGPKGVSVDFATGKAVVDEYDEGTTLLARPHLNESGSITLDLLMRAQNVQEVKLYNKDNGQVQSPKLAKAQIELSANLKPGESVAFWFSDDSTPEPTTSTGLSKIFRKKNPEKPYQSQLMLLVTPSIATEQVASGTGR